MKKRVTTILVIIIALVGVSLLLYPTVSDYINSLGHRKTIDDYVSEVEELDENEYEEIWNEAHAFNESLVQNKQFLRLRGEAREMYQKCLDVAGTGVMGYIEIPKAKVRLPIRHGTSEEVLQVGVGHLEGSSLPVGGESTHTILSGHRGLPSAMLFTNIDQLVEGDLFYLHILDETLAYEVDQIVTVEPREVNSLRIEEGQDYCTLVTCTPYGINTQRLLIRGHRVAFTPEQEPIEIHAQIYRLDLLIIALVILFVMALAGVFLLVRRHKRKKHKKEKDMLSGGGI